MLHYNFSPIFTDNYSWGPQTYGKLRSWVPDGDPELQRAWLDDYLSAVQWMRENQVPTAPRFDGIMTIGTSYSTATLNKFTNTSSTGIGFPIKIPHLHSLHRSRVESSKTGSEIWTNTAVTQLLQEHPGVQGSRIKGAIVRRESSNGQPASYYSVTARTVVLATGGFQGSSSLTAQYLGQGADNIFVRSNKGSVGNGLNLAVGAGAATSRGMNTYYGHLMAAPLRADQVEPKDYLPLAQYRESYQHRTFPCPLFNMHFTRPRE